MHAILALRLIYFAISYHECLLVNYSKVEFLLSFVFVRYAICAILLIAVGRIGCKEWGITQCSCMTSQS